MKENTYFPRLFSPFVLGNMKLKNRIVMLPMGTSFAGLFGEVTDHTLEYFLERARGGVGLIMLGFVSIDGRLGLGRLVLDSDWFSAGHYELVEAIHAQGARIGIQLVHPGRQRRPFTLEGRQPVSSSPLRSHRYTGEAYPVPRALGEKEIYDVIEKFCAAALRAKKVGYDLVEIHGAHGHLVNQFISPFMNQRIDKFGGSFENRMLFPMELIKSLRKMLGSGFPIGMRFGAEEFVEGGISIKDSPAVAKTLAKAGLTYLSVTAGIFETEHIGHDGMDKPEGWKSYMWQAIKESVDIPIIGGGGLKRPSFCEKILVEGKADLIGLARPLFADPQWPNKAISGRENDICLCISCWECAVASPAGRQGSTRCTVNSAAGREKEFSIINIAERKKRVMVIGGGPGGMEAARIASLRGHEVILYEKGINLGGNMLLAAVPPTKDKILWVRDYLIQQITQLNVKIELNTEVTIDLIRKISPDSIVIATGSEPIIPVIDGIKNKNVVTAWDVLAGNVKISNQAILMIGGSMIGCETADYLAQRTNRIKIIKMRSGEAAEEMQPENRVILMDRLKKADVLILSNKDVLQFKYDGVWVCDKDSKRNEFLTADSIVLALGAKPVRNLVTAIEDDGIEYYTVGDCEKPRNITEAIYEGSLVGRKI